MQSNIAQDVANSFLYADGLLEFLVKEKSFNEERVRSAVQRVVNAKGKSTQGEVCDLWCPDGVSTHLNSPSQQMITCPAGRLDSFFRPMGDTKKPGDGPARKRKEAVKRGPDPKKAKLGAIGKKK